MRKILSFVFISLFTSISVANERLVFTVQDNPDGRSCHDSDLFVVRLIDKNNDSKYEAIDVQGAELAMDLDGNPILVAYFATPEPTRIEIKEQSISEQGDLILVNYRQYDYKETDLDGVTNSYTRNEKFTFTLSANKKKLRYQNMWRDYSPSHPYVTHFDLWLKEITPVPTDLDCTYPIKK